MGQRWRVLAANVLLLGCVVLGSGVAAPRPAGAAAAATWAPERVRIEPVAGTEGIELSGLGSFRGAVELMRTGSGLAVVNEVGVEDYVRGISEVPSSWPGEALKAQAIAARTYALWEVRRQGAGAYRDVGADICATQACQVYTGLAKERAPDGNRWAAAVEATRGQVLWWRDGPIVAKYSSSNGGESVPGGQPYLRSVRDPDDAHSPLHQWQVSLSPADVAAALGLAGEVVAIQRAGDDVLVTAKARPDDALEEPEHLTIHALDFRDRINGSVPAPEGLPRTLPTVRYNPVLATDGSAVLISGRGWGHGIGLSQWGAFGKALRGMKAPDILAAYYSGLRPVAVGEPHVPATIRVALAMDAGAITATPVGRGGRLRVTTGAGEVLAHGTTSPWRFSPGRGVVTVTPGDGESGPATVALAAGTPASFAVGSPVEVQVDLGADATLAVRAIAPGATEGVPIGEPSTFPGGPVRLRLPAPTLPGDYVVHIDTDRGGGRTSTTTIVLSITTIAAAHATEVSDRGLATTSSSQFPVDGRTMAAVAGLLALAGLMRPLVGSARIAVSSRRALRLGS